MFLIFDGFLLSMLNIGYRIYPVISTDIGCGPDYGPSDSTYGHEKPLARPARVRECREHTWAIYQIQLGDM